MQPYVPPPVNPYVSQRTAANLGAPFSDVHGDGIYISFVWEMVTLKTTDPNKNGKREKRLKIIKQPKGDTSTASSSYITPEKAQELYPEHWENFTRFGEMPVIGTPLSDIPGLSCSQIQLIHISGLRSVEDLLSAGEEIINRIGHEGRYARSVAEEWMRKKTDNSDMIDYAERKAASDTRLAAAEKRATDAENGMRELQTQMAALQKMIAGGVAGESAKAAVGHMSGPGEAERVDTGGDMLEAPNPLNTGTGDIEDDYDDSPIS